MAENLLSLHAARRGQQRGIPVRLIQAVLAHHDIDHEAGGGCRVFRISRKALRNAPALDLSRQDFERLPQITLVFSDDYGRIVTVLRDRIGRPGRRYRRQLS